MSKQLTTSLTEIYSFHPCADGWKKILRSRGKTAADSVEFPLVDCCKSNSIEDVLWLIGKRRKEIQIAVNFAQMCANSVVHLTYKSVVISNADAVAVAVAAIATDAAHAASYAAAAAAYNAADAAVADAAAYADAAYAYADAAAYAIDAYNAAYNAATAYNAAQVATAAATAAAYNAEAADAAVAAYAANKQHNKNKQFLIQCINEFTSL